MCRCAIPCFHSTSEPFFSFPQTQIFLSQYIMGRDENLYPNANEFMPERWLRENKSEQAIHPFTTQPFGFGARSCLGKQSQP